MSGAAPHCRKERSPSRNGIIPAWMKRMTSHEPSKGKNRSAEGSVLRNSFPSVLRTRGVVSAVRRKKRREKPLIEHYERHEKEFHNLYLVL